MKVLDIQPVLESGDSIVLIHPDLGCGHHEFSNLLRCDFLGRKVWVAELPYKIYGADRYMCYHIEGDKLMASTWSCYLCEIDLNTGKIISTIFTK